MRELKKFIDELKELSYTMVSIGECFKGNEQLIKLDDLPCKIREFGIEEVVAEYYESFEFIDNNGKYIMVNGVY